MGLELNGWMVAWNPTYIEPDIGSDKPVGAVKVGIFPDKTGWSKPYGMTDGNCILERRDWKRDAQIGIMFINFHTLVVRDGIDPQAAHREFLKIDEYRRRISPDIPGADHG